MIEVSTSFTPEAAQRRVIRRFRLKFPCASWDAAVAWIAMKCGKHKSEKERQEKVEEGKRQSWRFPPLSPLGLFLVMMLFYVFCIDKRSGILYS
jgi:hypothetical protein